MGKDKTARRILQRFYWPTVFKDVAEYCCSCETCSCETCQKSSHKKPLVPLPIIGVPFQRIAMDIIGPLPRSRSGNPYVLVICDYATWYPEAIPLCTIDAENIAGELIQLFSRVGVPEELLTDQGSNFTSQLLKEVNRLLKISSIWTSPYHPQTDGLVERFNQTLKTMLRNSKILIFCACIMNTCKSMNRRWHRRKRHGGAFKRYSSRDSDGGYTNKSRKNDDVKYFSGKITLLSHL